MQFNVAQLLKSPIGTARAYDISEAVSAIEDAPTTRPVVGLARLTRTKRGVLVDAKLQTAVMQECSRCLENVETPLSIHIEEEFITTTDMVTGLHVTLDKEDDDAFRIEDDHILSLEEPLRQYALLAIPLKPMCRPDCQGLCATCGCNLNVSACKCREVGDDQLASPLASLLGQLDRKE
jgi:uncharacterized protein